MNTSRLGLGLYRGGVHVKIQMVILIKCFRFEIWANPVFSGRLVSKTGATFGLRKSFFKSFFKCTFLRGKVGPRPLPRGCNVTILMGMLVQWVWNLGKSCCFFLGECRKLALFFRLHKATATGALFQTRLQCNLQKLLRCHRDENLQYCYNSTRCDGKICWQINCQYYYKSFQYFCNFSEDITLSVQDIIHRNLRMWRQCNNLLKLHRHCE